MQTTRAILSRVDDHMGMMGVALTALCWNTEDMRKKYYSELSAEDIPHNMEMLFSELNYIYGILSEELNNLRGCKANLEKGSMDVQ